MRVIVNIDVPALRSAIDFYCDGLGLALTRIIDNNVAELSGASCIIYLLKNTQGSSATVENKETRTYSRHWTPIHCDFVVDDIAEATARAIQAGAKQESECIKWRGSKCITFSDPFGHGFCLIEFVGNTYQ